MKSTVSRTPLRFRAALPLLLLGLGYPASAGAQQVAGSLNVQRFNPAPGPRNFIVTRGARTDGEHAFGVGFVANYGYRPFVAEPPPASSDNPDVYSETILIVENLATFDVLASYTPIPMLQFGLRLPVTYAKGQGITAEGLPATLDGEGVDAFGLSDPELEAKFRFLPDVDSVFMPALGLFVTAPLGEATMPDSYAGHSNLTGGGRLILDLAQGPISAAGNVGYRFQPSARIGGRDGSELGSNVFYSVAGALEVSPLLKVMVDFAGESALTGDIGTNPMEIDGMLAFTPQGSSVSIVAGGGTGLTVGAVGVPQFRGIVGFSYTQEKSDPDEDGVFDADDLCPTEAEDKDGYEDLDGCPELDNDSDAIPDAADKCPLKAEDLDKFQDADGCPDNDNDKDGLPDVSDRCPNEAEIVNGFEDEDGCPDVPDTDGDGVKDPQDECPKEPEDTDGYEDTDGCPDLDNDGDGIPDDRDECVDEAETVNGEEDEDGCPEEEEE